MLLSRMLLFVVEVWLYIRYPAEISSPITDPRSGDRYVARRGSSADLGYYATIYAVRNDYLIVNWSCRLDYNSLEAIHVERWRALTEEKRYKPLKRLRTYGAAFWDLANNSDLPGDFNDVRFIEYADSRKGHYIGSPRIIDIRRRTFGDVDVKVPVYFLPFDEPRTYTDKYPKLLNKGGKATPLPKSATITEEYSSNSVTAIQTQETSAHVY